MLQTFFSLWGAQSATTTIMSSAYEPAAVAPITTMASATNTAPAADTSCNGGAGCRLQYYRAVSRHQAIRVLETALLYKMLWIKLQIITK